VTSSTYSVHAEQQHDAITILNILTQINFEQNVVHETGIRGKPSDWLYSTNPISYLLQSK